jgi:hypothetical protein
MMPNKIFDEYQGNTIRIGSDCYTFIGETTSTTNCTPNQIEATYASCLLCEQDSSSSSSTSSSSSESFDNVSSSTSSSSSESFGNFSSSSSSGIRIGGCTSPCDLTIQFKTYTIPDGLKVYSNEVLVLDTGQISTGSSFQTFVLEQLDCPVRVCVNAPSSGTAWALKVTGCGFNIDTTGGQIAEVCFEPPPPVPLAKVQCGGNSDPRIKVTICWSGGNDVSGTYNFLGASWSNGESKIVCSDNYFSKTTNTPSSQEYWKQQYTGGGSVTQMFIQGQQTAAARIIIAVDKPLQGPSYSTNDFSLKQYHGPFTGPSSANLSITSVGNTAGLFGDTIKDIEDDQFHQLKASTASHGTITIKWSAIAGNGMGTDTWGSWDATNLSYKATTGYEACP